MRAVGAGGAADDLRPFCGTGFRDATRIAEGAPEIWRDIVLTNRKEILAALDDLAEEIRACRAWIAAPDEARLTDGLSAAAALRRKLLPPAEDA